jgi:hypothetical protein
VVASASPGFQLKVHSEPFFANTTVCGAVGAMLSFQSMGGTKAMLENACFVNYLESLSRFLSANSN